MNTWTAYRKRGTQMGKAKGAINISQSGVRHAMHAKKSPCQGSQRMTAGRTGDTRAHHNVNLNDHMVGRQGMGHGVTVSESTAVRPLPDGFVFRRWCDLR